MVASGVLSDRCAMRSLRLSDPPWQLHCGWKAAFYICLPSYDCSGGGRANFIAPRATGNGGNGGAGASSAGGGSYPANPPEALLRQGTQPGMPDWANRTDNRVANLADDVGRMAHTLNDVKECVRVTEQRVGRWVLRRRDVVPDIA